MLESYELTARSLNTMINTLRVFFPPEEFDEYLDVFREFLETGAGILFKTETGIVMIFYEVEEEKIFRVDEVFNRGDFTSDQLVKILDKLEDYARSIGCLEIELTLDLTQIPITASQIEEAGMEIMSWEFEKVIPFPNNLQDIIGLIRDQFSELLEFEIMFDNGQQMELVIITSLAEAEEHIALGKTPLLLTITLDETTANSFHEATKDILKWDSINVVFSKNL